MVRAGGRRARRRAGGPAVSRKRSTARHARDQQRVGSAAAVGLVVTRYEPLSGPSRISNSRVGVYIYNTGLTPAAAHLPAAALCEQVPAARWHGYLRHERQYERLADRRFSRRAIRSPSRPTCTACSTRRGALRHCRSLGAAGQAQMEIFSQCCASPWVLPRLDRARHCRAAAMLHGDRWLHRACRMAKRFKGGLFQWLYTRLTAPPSGCRPEGAAG